jgi:hypothetical protein
MFAAQRLGGGAVNGSRETMMMDKALGATEIQQTAGGYGPPGGGYPPPGGGYGGPPPGGGGDVNTTLPLVFGILLIVLCGCIPGGVPAIIFAVQAGNAKSAGDMATAAKKAKTSLIISGIAAGVALLFWVAYIGMMVAAQLH